MKNQKQIVKFGSAILTALAELQKSRLKETQLKLQDIGCRSAEAVKDSHRFSVAVAKNWFCAAGQIADKIIRDIDDFSYYVGRFKEFVNRDQATFPCYRMWYRNYFRSSRNLNRWS
jgi:hypothetical protein